MNIDLLKEIVKATSDYITSKYGLSFQAGIVIGRLSTITNPDADFPDEEPVVNVDEIASDAEQFIFETFGIGPEVELAYGRLDTLHSGLNL